MSTARGSTVPSFPGYAANIIIGVTGALIVVVTLSGNQTIYVKSISALTSMNVSTVLTVTFVAFYFLRKRKFNTSSGRVINLY